MRKRKLKKGLAWILACALFMGMTPVNTQAKEQKNSEIVLFNANVTSGGSVTGGAATIEPTAEPKEIVTVTPFSGLWKYYGQKRTFIRDVHYAVSDEKDLPDGVTLTISSETAGKQQFVLKDERSSDEKQKISYQLAKNAPAYEIRAYHTNAVAKTEKDTINIADRTGLTDDKVEIEAPAGYRISSQASVDANWADTMSVTLTEGKNEIAYYLASKQADATKNAIDTTKKTITIVADFTAPQITSVSGFDSDTDTTSSGLITGNEPGKFYYVVLPKALGEEAEKESDPNAVSNIPNMEEMEKEIISIINTHADDDGWVDLSELGENLPKRVPGFDPRNYKCTKLKQFIEMFDSVEVRSARNPHNKILSIIYVRVKQKEEKPVLSKVRRGGKQKKNAAVVVTGME